MNFVCFGSVLLIIIFSIRAYRRWLVAYMYV